MAAAAGGAAMKAVLSGLELELELERELEQFLIKRKAKYSTESFSLLPTGFGTSLVKQRGSPSAASCTNRKPPTLTNWFRWQQKSDLPTLKVGDRICTMTFQVSF